MMQELAESKKESHRETKPDARDSTKFERGKPRWPLLQTTVDQLASEQAYMGDSHQENSPLTGSGTGPTSDPSRPANDFVDTPSTSAFPSLQSSNSPISPGPSSSSRTRFMDGEKPSVSIMRRGSRRVSNRTASGSAVSPASVFLSQWSRDSSSARAEPDDEGQTIGHNNEYVIGRQVGYGGFSVVKEVHTLQDGKPTVYAVKIVRKQLLGKSDEDNENLQVQFDHEVSIWRHLNHAHILRLLSVFDNDFAKFCIIPMNTGGTLFDLVRRRRRAGSQVSIASGRSEGQDKALQDTLLALPVVKKYLRQLASAIHYLHEEMRMVHRDIKLENCLVTNSNVSAGDGPIGDVLLCDFGMAQHLPAQDSDDVFSNDYEGDTETFEEGDDPHNIGPGQASTNVAGSLQYASPELIRSQEPVISPTVDVWAFGVVTYALLTSNLPFNHAFQPKLVELIAQGEWDVERLEQAVGCSGGSQVIPATQFVKNCLAMNPSKRWSIQSLAADEFLTSS